MIDREFSLYVHRLLAMQPLRFSVDVVMERVPLANRWVNEFWRPAWVQHAEPAAHETVERLDDEGPAARWRVGPYTIELHPVEAEGYFLNVTSANPCVFIMWRMLDDVTPSARPVIVTVSYNEAARLLDGGERVDNVPMPDWIMHAMKPFVAAHYKPEPRRKVRRNDPFAAENAPSDANSSK